MFLDEIQKENRAKQREKQYYAEQERLLQDLETRIPRTEEWLEHHKRLQEAVIAPQRELVKREIDNKKNKAAVNIQRMMKGYSQRQKLIEDEMKKSNYTGSTADITQQQLLRELRQPRSDIGVKRNPYMTRSRKQVDLKVKAREESNKLIDTLLQQQIEKEIADALINSSIALRESRQEKRPVGRPRKERNPVGRPRKQPMEKVVEEDSHGAAGSGLRGRRIKPKKRVVKTSKNELMKNRLRLVASQIEAGNTNPTLIKVNELYKTIYNIDNAYTLLKK